MGNLDENYFKKTEGMTHNRVEDILDNEEHVLLRLKPKKSAYIFSHITAMMPIALLWLLFDGFFIGMMIWGFSSSGTGIPIPLILFFVFFFGFHLMPVWIWISHIVKATAGWKNIEYVLTEKRIIIRSGIVGIDFKNIYYSDITGVNLRVGLFDRLFKVGDIYISAKSQSEVLYDITDPYFILKKLQNIVIDLKTDVFFPNDLRPEENHGFRTKYKPKRDDEF